METYIELDLAQMECQPNSSLEGNVTLIGLRPNKIMKVQLELYWCDVGRCDPSKIIVAEKNFTLAGEKTHAFTFDLPNAPQSYDGMLFRRIWCVRAVGILADDGSSYAETIQQFRMMQEPTPDPYMAVGLLENPFILDVDQNYSRAIVRYLAAETTQTSNNHIETNMKKDTVSYREEWQGVDKDLWLERGHSTSPKPKSRQLVQLLGVKGAGKSSHLKHWQTQQPGPYLYYPAWWPNRLLAKGFTPWQWQTWQLVWSEFAPQLLRQWLRPPPLAAICYWDEADRMPWIWLVGGFLAAAVRGDTVCIGTHSNLAWIARCLGLRVSTIYLESISAQDVYDWASLRFAAVSNKAVNNSQESSQKAPILTLEHAAQLAHEGAGSWRDVATALHVWIAREVLAE